MKILSMILKIIMFNKMVLLKLFCIKIVLINIIRLMKKRYVLQENEELKRLEERESFLPNFDYKEDKNYD